MTKRQSYIEQIKARFEQIKFKLAKKQEPEKKQITIMQENSPKIEMQKINQLKRKYFSKNDPMVGSTFRIHIFSKPAAWYWIIIGLALGSAAAVLTIPTDSFPINYIRNVLSLIFILFLPGFSFIKTLFPTKLPILTINGSLENIVRVALSLGLSLVIVPMIGLILYFTPFGIGLESTTSCLLAFTLVFATVAIFRENKTKSLFF